MIFATLCREITESNLMQKSSFFIIFHAAGQDRCKCKPRFKDAPGRRKKSKES